tara:strand:+ start:495 stop:608 length:114 start_codon:yes stop_codon:yes gene_type:complete
MNHDAIYALYPNVVTIDDTAGAAETGVSEITITEIGA